MKLLCHHVKDCVTVDQSGTLTVLCSCLWFVCVQAMFIHARLYFYNLFFFMTDSCFSSNEPIQQECGANTRHHACLPAIVVTRGQRKEFSHGC